ncbi:MAG: xanthine dehydrogenase family protein molybdopterin-binding subunit [Betaproteobacteria bacterium]|nr:xanthine dehydrogenase family protein molybdopterin-binding subunit [Betaproteobacteria bacterium]
MPQHTALDPRFSIGQPVLRTEDPRLLTGRGRYTDDVSLPGQAYAAIARSVQSHGRIVAIDTAAALAAPGVLAVYTGADLEAEGCKGFPHAMPVKSRDGSPIKVPYYPALAVGRVRHVGQAIAVVIAETAAQARDAAELIAADIEAMTPITDMTLSQDAPALFDDVPRNVCVDFFDGDEAATTAAFAQAAHVTRLRLDNNRLVVLAMEPRAALADYDSASGRFTVYAGSQGAFGLRGSLATVLGVPPAKVRVICGDVGGSFGMKGQPYDATIAVMFAARKLGRPVKWCADRQESFLTDHHGRASLIDSELALDRDGHFLAIRLTGWGDVGAYVTLMGALSPTAVLARNLPSVYRIKAMSVSVRAVLTNTVPTGPYRGAGRPESKYIIERLIDQAARETGIDRVELRRRNLVRPGDLPWTTPNGPVYDSGDFPGCLEAVVKKADWAGFAARRRESEARGMLRGIAVSSYLEHTAGPGKELADIRFNGDGTVTLVNAGKDFGMGHAAPFAQVLSHTLGIPFDAIKLDQTDSDQMIGPGMSGGSRSAVATSGAIIEASKLVIENGRKLAGRVLEAASDDIEFNAGRFRVVGTDRDIGIMELASRVRTLTNLPEDMPQKLDAAVSHNTAPATFPNGSHVAEVEVDPETGVVRILRYSVVDDFGTLINPMVVEGQVHGGIGQGVGQALMERTVYDDQGQLLTGSLMDYCLPRADDMANIDFTSRPMPAKTNPLGVKGCGEAGVAGSLPTVVNAVLDALHARGVAHIDTPLTPQRVWQALRDAKH